MNPFEQNHILSNLEGKQLSAITFVQDYVQLHFDGPVLTAYVWPSIWTELSLLTLASSGYRDALCACIGKIVARGYEVHGEQLVILFVDGIKLIVSLRDADRDSTEAAMFVNPDSNEWEVW